MYSEKVMEHFEHPRNVAKFPTRPAPVPWATPSAATS